MVIKQALISEWLWTSLVCAVVRFFTSVYPQMSFKITFESESFLTHWIRTNKLLLSLMMFYVEIKLCLASKALATAFERTLERLIRNVCQLMVFEMALCEERLATSLFWASMHSVSLRLKTESSIWSVLLTWTLWCLNSELQSSKVFLHFDEKHAYFLSLILSLSKLSLQLSFKLLLISEDDSSLELSA